MDLNNEEEFYQDEIWSCEKKRPTGTTGSDNGQRLQAHIDDAAKTSVECEQADLLRWHYPLRHVSFKKLKALALIGIIPKRLADAKAPI